MDKFIKYFIWVVFISPVVYLAAAWKTLPEKVPMHYNLKGEVDRYGNKTELLTLLAILVTVTIGVYFLMVNIHRIDPKRKYSSENISRMRRFAFAICIFLAALTCFFIHSSQHAEMKFNARFITVGIGLLFAVIGNYLYNIKPNYFAGIRTPWALENEENWRLTHRLASKIWFAGGLLLAVLGFFLSSTAAFILMMVVIAVLVLIPFIYSWRIYTRMKKMAAPDNGK